jgi:hypothetical protein
MTLKNKFLAAAAALTLPALAYAQQPAPTPPASAPATTPPSATPPAPSSTTTPPTQQPADATETGAQQPANTADDPVDQGAQATPPAADPAAPPSPTPAPGAQAQTSPSAGAPAAAGPVQVATAADIRAGVQVHDQQGGAVGTIESADAATAVVNTGTARARLALNSFGRNSAGLVISMTKAQLEAAVAAARPGA